MPREIAKMTQPVIKIENIVRTFILGDVKVEARHGYRIFCDNLLAVPMGRTGVARGDMWWLSVLRSGGSVFRILPCTKGGEP
jgi:hypothetical protein